jgi:hypothetical protein
MPEEVGAPGEGLAALDALVGLLTDVPAPVQSQGRALRERLPALAAREDARPGAGSNPQPSSLPGHSWRFPGPENPLPWPRSLVVWGYPQHGLADLGASGRRAFSWRDTLLGGQGAAEGESLYRPTMSPTALFCEVPARGRCWLMQRGLAVPHSDHLGFPSLRIAQTGAKKTRPLQPCQDQLLGHFCFASSLLWSGLLLHLSGLLLYGLRHIWDYRCVIL